MDNVEQWRSIAGHEGTYEVSSYGRVRSLDRTIVTGNGPRKLKGRTLRPATDKIGRRNVVLYGVDNKKTRRIHQLVAEAFIGPRPPGMEVCHRDGDPGNNHVSNLRYGTHSENMIDKKRHGTDYQRNKKTCPRGHQLIEPNLVPSALRDGRRDCKACSRTRAYVNVHPDMRPLFDKIADGKYADIIGK